MRQKWFTDHSLVLHGPHAKGYDLRCKTVLKIVMSTAGSSPEQADGGIEMSEGIMNIVRPAIEKLDAQVHATRASQYNLNAQIQDLAQYLKDITNEQQTPYDLDMYVRKLDDSRKRIQLVGNVLQSVHERMGKLQRNIAREAYQKKQLISRAPPLPPKQ